MFPNQSQLRDYEKYKYRQHDAWLLDKSIPSYWGRHSEFKDFRSKQYTSSGHDEDDRVLAAFKSSDSSHSDIDLLADFKSLCLDYTTTPSLAPLLCRPYISWYTDMNTELTLALSRCLSLRHQIALHRNSKKAAKERANERVLAERNKVHSNELDAVSSIVEIGIRTNYTMLNAVRDGNPKLKMKMLSVLSSLLANLGPLALRQRPNTILQRLLLDLATNASNGTSKGNANGLDASHPLKALLTLTLTQSTLQSAIESIDGFLSNENGDQITMQCPKPLYQLVAESFPITLCPPIAATAVEHYDLKSCGIPKVWSTFLDRKMEQKNSSQNETNELVVESKEEVESKEDEVEKEEVTLTPKQEKKAMEAKKRAIEQRLTELLSVHMDIAEPRGAVMASWREFIMVLDANGLHKMGTGYSGTERGKEYALCDGVHLSDDNIAWMTPWSATGGDHHWLLIRFRYDIALQIKDKEPEEVKERSLSGRIVVVDLLKMEVLGVMKQDGSGSVATANNSERISLGVMTTGIGPIVVEPGTDTLGALWFEERVDGPSSLKMERFILPKLDYADTIEVEGLSEKNSGSKRVKRVKRSKEAQSAAAFGWGQNSCGGMGLGSSSQCYGATPLTLLPKQRMEACFAGNETSFFVTANGAVWAHGRNGSGQLGLGKANYSNQQKPLEIESLRGKRVIKISGSRHGSHTLFLTAKGKVYCAGNNGNGQVKNDGDGSVADLYCIEEDKELAKAIKSKGKKHFFFVDIAAACNRSMAVTKKGELYCWGNNNRRSMGLDAEQSFRSPTLEKRLAEKLKVKFRHISGGYAFSLAIDSEGHCWGSGDNGYGQIGVGDTNQKTEWTQMTNFKGKWTHVSCGYYHSIGIAKKKSGGLQLYGWGNNQNGQLGLGDTTKRTEPQPITFPNKDQVKWAESGGFFSGALSVKGDVYTWGSNSYGEQGVGNTTTSRSPGKVNYDGFDEESVQSLAIGYYHCLAVVRNRAPPIGPNELHHLRWYAAPDRLGALDVHSEKATVRMYTMDDSRVTATEDINIGAVKSENTENIKTTENDALCLPVDIGYSALSHCVFALYGEYQKSNLSLRRWVNGKSENRSIWNGESLLSQPQYLLTADTTDSTEESKENENGKEQNKPNEQSLTVLAVNLMAAMDLMSSTRLVDPTMDEEAVEIWKEQYGEIADKSKTLMARSLCIAADEEEFETLISRTMSTWKWMKSEWIENGKNRKKGNNDLNEWTQKMKARIYWMIALLRILLLNLKMKSAESEDDGRSVMSKAGEQLFQLLDDVVSTVSTILSAINDIESKSNSQSVGLWSDSEVDAMRILDTLCRDSFKFAFNVFYGSWQRKGQFLVSLIDEMLSNEQVSSFQVIALENILKTDGIHALFQVNPKQEAKLLGNEVDGNQDDEEKEDMALDVMDKALQLIAAADSKPKNQSQVQSPSVSIEQLVFQIVASVQMYLSNDTSIRIITSKGSDDNVSALFLCSLKVFNAAINILNVIADSKEEPLRKYETMSGSRLLSVLLPAAIRAIRPHSDRLRPPPAPYSEMVTVMARLNESLHSVMTQLQSGDDQKTENLSETHSGSQEDEVMVIESDHPFTPTECQRWAACFDESVIAVTVQFDIRCRLRTADDQLVIGFPENPNYFHGDLGYANWQIPGPLLVPSNVVHVTFAPYGNQYDRTGKAPYDAEISRWGFRIYLTPHRRSSELQHSDELKPFKALQLELCDALASVARLSVTNTSDPTTSSSTAKLQIGDLLKTELFRNGKESEEVILEYNQILMDRMQKEFVIPSASHCVGAISENDVFAGIGTDISIDLGPSGSLGSSVDLQSLRSLQKSGCLVEAKLYQPLARIARKVERDWTQSVSWMSYTVKQMEVKLTQFAMCWDGADDIYLFGGMNENNSIQNSVWKFSVSKEEWTKCKAMDFAVKCHTVRRLSDGRMVSMGGNVDHFMIYNPLQDEWDLSMNVPPNKKPFGIGVRFAITQNIEGEDVIYCLGGSKDGDNDETNAGGNRFWRYNVQRNEWRVMAKYPNKVRNHGLAVDAFGRVYAVGGKPEMSQCWCFDPLRKPKKEEVAVDNPDGDEQKKEEQERVDKEDDDKKEDVEPKEQEEVKEDEAVKKEDEQKEVEPEKEEKDNDPEIEEVLQAVPEGEWVRCPDLPLQTCSMECIFDGDKRYLMVLGGSDTVGDHDGAKRNQVYCLDTITGVWKATSGLPYSHKDSRAVIIGNKCHVFGGSTGSVSDKHVVGTCSKVLVPDIIKETPNDIGNCFRKEGKKSNGTTSKEKNAARDCTTFIVDEDTLNIRFLPVLWGQYRIEVLLDGQPLKNSPLLIDVKPTMNFVLGSTERERLEVEQQCLFVLGQWTQSEESSMSNTFEFPAKALFTFDTKLDSLSTEWRRQVGVLEYQWQKYETLEQKRSLQREEPKPMPSEYKCSLSTGIYGGYALERVMPSRYSAAFNTGVYGSYTVDTYNTPPDLYRASLSTGIYGAYRVQNGRPDEVEIIVEEKEADIAAPPESEKWLKMIRVGLPLHLVEMKMKAAGADSTKLEGWIADSDLQKPAAPQPPAGGPPKPKPKFDDDSGSESDSSDSEEDTFNALFKHLEKHSTVRKLKLDVKAKEAGADALYNLDAKVMFGAPGKAALPRKMKIHGKETNIRCGSNIPIPKFMESEDMDIEQVADWTKNSKAVRAALDTKCAERARGFVFETILKHFGMNSVLTRYMKGDDITKDEMGILEKLWKLSNMTTNDILRMREDFERKKMPIKTKEEMDGQNGQNGGNVEDKPDIKKELEAFKKARAEARNPKQDDDGDGDEQKKEEQERVDKEDDDKKEDVEPKEQDEVKEDEAVKKEDEQKEAEPEKDEKDDNQENAEIEEVLKPVEDDQAQEQQEQHEVKVLPKEADEFLKMVRAGVPLGGVKIRMKQSKVDPDKLEEWMDISGIKGPRLEPVQEENGGDNEKEKEIKHKGICIEFDNETGNGLIAVAMEEEKGGGIRYYTVRREEIFGDSTDSQCGPNIARGSAVEFVVFTEDDGTEIAVDVTGPNGEYVTAPKIPKMTDKSKSKVDDEMIDKVDDEDTEQNVDDNESPFDPFQRGHDHLEQQCKVFMNLRCGDDIDLNLFKVQKDSESNAFMDLKEMKEMALYKSISDILSSNESMSWNTVKQLIEDRCNILSQRQSAYDSLDRLLTLFAGNGNDETLYIQMVGYLVQSLCDSEVRERPEWTIKKDDPLKSTRKQWIEKRGMKLFHPHYLAEIDGADQESVRKYQATIWKMMDMVIQRVSECCKVSKVSTVTDGKCRNYMELKQMMLTIAAGEWRVEDLKHFEKVHGLQSMSDFVRLVSGIESDDTKREVQADSDKKEDEAQEEDSVKNEDVSKDEEKRKLPKQEEIENDKDSDKKDDEKSDEKKEETQPERERFWDADTFKTQIMKRELSRRREMVPKRKGIIREELPSRTWMGDMDLDENLEAKRIKQGGAPTMWLKKLHLHINSVRVDAANNEDAEDDSYHFVLSGDGQCPWMANRVRVEGEYRPFMEEDNVSLTIQPKLETITLDIAAWSCNDPQKDGLNRAHIKVEGSGENVINSGYGLHLVLINLFNGRAVKFKNCNTYSDGSESNRTSTINWLKDLPPDHALIATTYYSCGQHWKEEIYDALKVYGWSWKEIESYQSLVFVANTNGTVYFEKMTKKSEGPIVEKVNVPMKPGPKVVFKGRFKAEDESQIEGKWHFSFDGNESDQKENEQSQEPEDRGDKGGDEKETEQKPKDMDTDKMDSPKSKEKKEDSKKSSSPKAEWLTYAIPAKLRGEMTFSVTSKLENGWKWTEKDTATTLKDVDPFRLNSWLSVPRGQYTVRTSSGDSSKMKMDDNNWESYWQSSHGQKHWIQMEFEETACVSGIGLYLNCNKDNNYFADQLKVTLGIKDGDDTESVCVLTHCVQRDFKGLYVMDLSQRSSDCNENRDEIEDEIDDDTKAIKDAICAHPRGYSECEWLKLEMICDQARYVRIRHIAVYSKQCDEFDARIRSCSVPKSLLLEDAGMRCLDLLDHMEAEKKLKEKREGGQEAVDEKESAETGDRDLYD